MTPRELAFDLMRSACERAGYRFELLDPRTRLCLVGAGQRQLYLQAGELPLNAHAAVLIARSKPDTELVLRRAGYRVPDGVTVALTGEGGRRAAFDAALPAWIGERGFPLFVKPDAGSLGRLARRVDDEDELREHLAGIARRYDAALVQELVAGEEYRVFVLDGEPLVAYRHRVGRIEGDGRRTFAELLEAYAARHPSMNLEYGIDRELILRQMLQLRCSWRSVLPVGAAIRLSDTANSIAGGAVDQIRTNEFGGFGRWAAGVARALDLRVCGIDAMVTDPDDPAGGVVLEVNAKPGLTSLCDAGYRDLAISVWERVLTASLDAMRS